MSQASSSASSLLLKLVAVLLLVSWLAMLWLLMAGREDRRLEVLADGRYARIDLKTGKVEGNILFKPAKEPEAPASEAETPPEAEETPEAEIPAAEETPEAVEPSPAPEEEADAELPAEAESPSPIPPPPVALPSVRAPLNLTPNPELTEVVGTLALPKPAENGVRPADYYKKPFTPADGVPSIAVIIRDLGLHAAHTEAALKLDESITLAFSPYAGGLAGLVTRARAAGHEVWLQVPMEPEGYPANDAGPYALLQSVPLEANRNRLRQVMGSASAYVGLVAPPGELFSSSSLMGEVMEDVRRRGLLLLMHHDVTTLPRFDGMALPVSRTVEPTAAPAQLREIFTELETLARSRGQAILSLPNTPGLLAELPGWIAGLPQKSIALAPVSALAGATPP